MKLLIVSPHDEVRAKVKFALESHFGCEALEAADAMAAGPVLQRAGKIEALLIEKPKVFHSDLADLKGLPPELPILLFCAELEDPRDLERWKNAKLADASDILKTSIREVEGLAEKGLIEPHAIHGEFCRIQTRLLLQTYPLRGDIYIKLSDVKFVKLFPEGERFEVSDMEKYTFQKGIQYMYVRFAQVRDFLDKYTADLQALADQTDTMDPDEVQKMHNAQYETAQELVQKHPEFAQDVQVLAKSYVKSTIKSMARQPNLKTILERLKGYEGQYIATHSTHAGYVACAIASQMEWGSDATYHKLTLAGFLHDIYLQNHELARCETLDEVKQKGFSDKDFQAFKAHPLKAADIAQTFQEVPLGVDAIVLQHHEHPDGTGFPRGLTQNYISPLASVFIVAHDLSHAMIEGQEAFALERYLEEAKEKFKGAQFRKVLDAVAKLKA